MREDDSDIKLVNEVNDKRGWCKSSADFFSSLSKEAVARLDRKNNPLIGRSEKIFTKYKITEENEVYYDPEDFPWKDQSSEGLIIFIHGLNSSPLAWSNYFLELQSAKPSYHYFLPYVYEKGYCTLEQAALPILNAIEAYFARFPQNEVFIVGHSNGARILAYLDCELDQKYKINLASIAGPFLGSQMVARLSNFGLISFFGFSEAMTKEFEYEGSFAKSLLRKWLGKMPRENCRAIFFASKADFRITPTCTSLPSKPGSEYVLFDDESHVTILDASKEYIIQFILNTDKLAQNIKNII